METRDKRPLACCVTITLLDLRQGPNRFRRVPPGIFGFQLDSGIPVLIIPLLRVFAKQSPPTVGGCSTVLWKTPHPKCVLNCLQSALNPLIGLRVLRQLATLAGLATADDEQGHLMSFARFPPSVCIVKDLA